VKKRKKKKGDIVIKTEPDVESLLKEVANLRAELAQVHAERLTLLQDQKPPNKKVKEKETKEKDPKDKSLFSFF